MRPAPPPSESSMPSSSTWQSPAAPPPTTSPWHSPVPYLFGGLAAMLGLIALALLILACSYWKLNSYLDAATSSADHEATGGDGSKSPAVAATASPAASAGLVAVVMAGEKMPTFLAAPIVHRVAVDDAIPAVPAAAEGSSSTAAENGCKAGAGDSGGAAVNNAERAVR